MSTRVSSVGLVAVCACAGFANAATVRLNVIAVSNTQAPGLSQGIMLTNGGASSPQIDNLRNIVLRSTVSGVGVTTSSDGCIFYYPLSGSPSLIAREGDIAPGAGGASFLSISNPVFENGRIAFTATLTGAGVTSANNQAIFAGPIGAVSMVARKGDLVPVAAANIGMINDFALSENGTIAFRAILVNGAVTTMDDTCVLLNFLGLTTMAGREGTLLPAISATAKIGDLGSGPLVANSSGSAEGVAPLTGAGSGSTNTLFRFTTIGPQIIARAKAPAPGTPSGVTFMDIPQITTVNRNGTSFFQGILTGTGINSGNNVGVWQGTPGDVSLSFRMSTYATGTGLYFQALTSPPSVNSAGMIAFGASLWGGGATAENSAGIFTWNGAQHRLLAWAGSHVPDLADGSIYAADAPGRVIIADSGLVFVKMRSIANAVSRDGLFVFRPDGSMSTLVREGDSFAVSAGDVRTVSAVYVASTGNSTGADGRGTPVGGSNEIVAQLAFAGGGNAIVRISGACTADFNSDAVVDFFDYLDFVDAFSSMNAAADVNMDGVIDFFDYLDFVDSFSTGC